MSSGRTIKLVASILLILIFAGVLYVSVSPSMQPPNLTVNTYVKPQIMAAIYKMYANPDFNGGFMWLSRTVFKNDGKVPISGLSVTYKVTVTGLTEYPSDWSTPTTYEMLLPGSTVVDLYYPSFPSKILDLTTTSPSQLSIKWSYKATGVSYDSVKTANFDFLARNEIVYTSLAKEEFAGTWDDMWDNAWALAAWVTPNEPVLRDFVGHYVSGFTPEQDTIVTQLWMQALLAIDQYGIKYQFTPDSPWDQKNYYQVTQTIKFPKDVIQSKSGTCIELTLLMASIAAAYGLRAYVFLLSGHAIPIIYLPESKNYLPIESTAIGKNPWLANIRTPQDAIKFATTEVQDALKTNQHTVVDVQAMWKAGVIPPQ